ncbi:MAG: DinB family protein [Candidatus Acidiferrales bacterium]
MTLFPELERIRREVEAVSVQTQSLCRGLNEDQLAWRPAPGRWSIAENFLHLDLTIHTFIPIVDRAIEDARRENLTSNGPFPLGVMGKLFVWYVEPPPILRLPAPKTLKPLLNGPASDVLPKFLGSQQSMLQRLENANGLDINRVRITSPFASYIRMSLFALFSVWPAHERRHVAQAAHVRQQLRA